MWCWFLLQIMSNKQRLKNIKAGTDSTSSVNKTSTCNSNFLSAGWFECVEAPCVAMRWVDLLRSNVGDLFDAPCGVSGQVTETSCYGDSECLCLRSAAALETESLSSSGHAVRGHRGTWCSCAGTPRLSDVHSAHDGLRQTWLHMFAPPIANSVKVTTVTIWISGDQIKPFKVP